MRTKSLFHFTEERDVLFSILKNGFWPRFCFEDIRWASDVDFYGSAMVCFCDIALSKLSKHTAFYGSYGVGMTKEWGEENGLNPLLYVSSKSVVAETLNGMMRNPDFSRDESKVEVMITLQHLKPLRGRMDVRGESIDKEFYEECEWRFVDTSVAGVFPENITDDTPLENYNDKTRNNYLKFGVEDVRYLLVEKSCDIAPLVDFIYSDLKHFEQEDKKILITKILVLEELEKDL